MKLYNENLFEKQLPNFAYLDFNQWVQEDVQIISEYMVREGYDMKTIVAVTAALRWNT